MRPRVIVTTIIVLTGCATLGNSMNDNVPHAPLTASKAAQLRPEGQTLWVEGYVIYLHRCEPCPEDADCEQCLADHLVLADLPETVADYPHAAGRKDWLFVDPPAQDLIVGKRYRLLVEWSNGLASGSWPPTVGYVLEVRPGAD